MKLRNEEKKRKMIVTGRREKKTSEATWSWTMAKREWVQVLCCFGNDNQSGSKPTKQLIHLKERPDFIKTVEDITKISQTNKHSCIDFLGFSNINGSLFNGGFDHICLEAKSIDNRSKNKLDQIT
ncbi:hypothetical protein CEXT_383121 [Caerostris extrusa]|uniref:Uncharacterized protein n=1 Tax=Caerostris extrusa TaxID=172846 RepID=A0AAV4NX48_CAEEX|nr:hypothetical protein CEXT_383121 [Caerostris extrusa]